MTRFKTGRFYIVGVDEATGRVGNDASESRRYFELGWEVVTTHFDVKEGLASGRIDPASDAVVTCAGREFLYVNDFRNVLPYEKFSRDISRSASECQDMTLQYRNGVLPSDYFVRLSGGELQSRFLRLYPELGLSAALPGVSRYHSGLPYCCFAVRRRDHGAYRNMSHSRGLLVVNTLLRRWNRVFIVGHDASDLVIDERVQQVDLATYVALISDPLCQVVIGTMTGPMQLAGLFSRAPVCLVILNYDACDVAKENHPVLLGQCVRMSPSKFLFSPPSCFEAVLAEMAQVW